MPSNSGGTQEPIPRNPDGTFPKGVSGNPHGPKAGYRHMTTKILEAITKVSEGSGEADDIQIVRTLVKKAKEGDMRGIELIMGYIDGKPKQDVGLTGSDGGPVKIEVEVKMV